MMPCASGMRNRRGFGFLEIGTITPRPQDGADFEEAEAQFGQTVDVIAVLVQAGSEADRIGKLEAHDVDRARCDRLGHQAGDAIDAHHADAVCRFSVEGEEEFADEWIEHNREFYRIDAPVRLGIRSREGAFLNNR